MRSLYIKMRCGTSAVVARQALTPYVNHSRELDVSHRRGPSNIYLNLEFEYLQLTEAYVSVPVYLVGILFSCIYIYMLHLQ